MISNILLAVNDCSNCTDITNIIRFQIWASHAVISLYIGALILSCSPSLKSSSCWHAFIHFPNFHSENKHTLYGTSRTINIDWPISMKYPWCCSYLPSTIRMYLISINYNVPCLWGWDIKYWLGPNWTKFHVSKRLTNVCLWDLT